MPGSCSVTTFHRDLEPVRDKLAQSLADRPGFDSVGITKRAGEWALSVLLAEPGYCTSQIPQSYGDYPIVKRKASEFVPH
jgi:hypothetical protein